jgi:hypothetical protein
MQTINRAAGDAKGRLATSDEGDRGVKGRRQSLQASFANLKPKP